MREVSAGARLRVSVPDVNAGASPNGFCGPGLRVAALSTLAAIVLAAVVASIFVAIASGWAKLFEMGPPH